MGRLENSCLRCPGCIFHLPGHCSQTWLINFLHPTETVTQEKRKWISDCAIFNFVFYFYCVFPLPFILLIPLPLPTITTLLSMSLTSFFLFAPSLYHLNPQSCHLLSVYEPVSILLVSSVCSLDSTYEWNYKVFVFLWLAYFTQQNILRVHPCCYKESNFFFFTTE